MAVIISNGAVNLNTVNGFYRVEASNLSTYSTTRLTLSTTRTIAVTFANVGNCLGVVLALEAASAVSSAHRDVTVTLEEFTGVWTVRRTTTLTAATISNNIAADIRGVWMLPFTWAGYAITTAPATWRIQVVSAAGAAANHFQLRTSNGTNPFFAAYCDNALSFAANDTVICKDIVSVTASATVRGILGTGDSVTATAIWICKGPDGTAANCSLLRLPEGVAKTLTVDGAIAYGAHAGVQMGTVATPITLANKTQIVFSNVPTSGTQTAFRSLRWNDQTEDWKQSLLVYGTMIQRQMKLTVAASAGAGSITVADTTNTTIGDRIGLCNQTGNFSNQIYTVTGKTATTISFTPNLVNGALNQSPVINFDWYPCAIRCSGTNQSSSVIRYPNHFTIQGCLLERQNIRLGRFRDQLSQDDPGNQSQYRMWFGAYFTTTGFTSAIIPYMPAEGFNVDGFHAWQSGLFSGNFFTSTSTAVISGLFDMNDSLTCGANAQNILYPSFTTMFECGFSNMTSGNDYVVGLAGTNYNITECKFYRCGAGICVSGASNIFLGANKYDGCGNAICFVNPAVNFISSGDLFGQTEVNTTDIGVRGLIAIGAIPYVQAEFQSPTGLLTVDSRINLSAAGTHIRIVDNEGTPNADFGYLTNGLFQRTGTALTDTTVRTAPGFALRLEPNRNVLPLNWSFPVPVGNISAKTMTVSCWVRINTAAYYGGGHIKPTLTVNYDNGSTVTAVATGTAATWQLLACTFTAASAYPQLTVSIGGASDAAAAADRRFYIDDINVAFPAGVQLNLGAMDLWANAMPVTPPIATNIAAADVWAAQMSNISTVTGSAGESLNKAQKDSALVKYLSL